MSTSCNSILHDKTIYINLLNVTATFVNFNFMKFINSKRAAAQEGSVDVFSNVSKLL